MKLFQGALALFLVAALAACGASPETAAPATEAPPVTVRTRTLEARDVQEPLRLPADLQPLRRAQLAAEVAGTVEAVHVDLGDRVAAGKTLVAIDTRVYVERVAEAEAVDRQRQAQIERAQALFERRAITQQQLLDAVTQRDVAAAQLASARLELAKSRLVAPWAGTVAARQVEVGDYVSPGQALVELLDVRTLVVRAPAPAPVVPSLRLGLPAELSLSILPGEVFSGKVVRLGAALDPTARTLDVEVEIPNPDGRLRPGMFGELAIAPRTFEDVLLVPLGAVIELDEGRAVYVEEAGKAARRPVALGAVIGDEVIVEEGLMAGDRVIVLGQQNVSPGQPVVTEASAVTAKSAGS